VKIKKQNRAPSVFSSGGDVFYFSSKHLKMREAQKNADKIRRQGFRVRNKYMKIGSQKMHVVYRGGRCGKCVKSYNKRM